MSLKKRKLQYPVLSLRLILVAVRNNARKCPSNVLLRHVVPSHAGGCMFFANADVKYTLRAILKNTLIRKTV